MGFKVKLSSTACYDPRYDSTGLWEGSGSMIIYFEFRKLVLETGLFCWKRRSIQGC